MRDTATDGRLQVTAGVSLLEYSRLVEWIPKDAKFVPVDRQDFESSWRERIDPIFGRLMCWISFSTGAEFLAKGVCLVNRIDIRKPTLVPLFPRPGDDIDKWARDFRRDQRARRGWTRVIGFGSLGALTHDDDEKNSKAALAELCTRCNATHKEQNLLFAAFDFLRLSIRNRDVHAYVPNVRDMHYHLVPELFSDCFSILVSWLPGGPSTLDQWKAGAQSFVASLAGSPM